MAKRFTKKDPSRLTIPKSNFSKRLRNAHDLIKRRKNGNALTILDAASKTGSTPWQQGKILALAADSELALGRFESAVNIYQQAGDRFQQAEHPDWFRAAFGEIRALLKGIKTVEAYTKARTAAKKAEEDQARMDQITRIPPQQLTQLQSLIIQARPPRPSTILTRLGVLFLEEGYPETAEEFLRKAMELSPNGASRARQAMARIHYSRNNFEEAERLARESLLMGRFQAKTVAAWPTYIEARIRRSKSPHDTELYNTLIRHGQRPVVERSVLLIVSVLRSHGIADWKILAQSWIGETKPAMSPVFSIELSKMLLADARITEPNPLPIATAASRLLSQKLISPMETVATIKVLATYGLRNGDDGKQLQNALNEVRKRFDPVIHQKAIHSAALGAMLAKRHDVARGLLRPQVDALPAGSESWGRTLWALARMESAIGHHARAAEYYLKLAEHDQTPPRFQLQGLLEWLGQIQKSGRKPDIPKTRTSLTRILSRINDFKMQLDAARQLALAGSDFIDLMRTAADSGTTAALRAFHEAATPNEAIHILIHLARRQYYDLSRVREVLQFWEAMHPQKREWLWSENAEFWEYMALLIRSYEIAENPQEVDRLAASLLSADTTPPRGVGYVASCHGEILIQRGRFKDGIKQLERAIPAAPTHPTTGPAYYWKALIARKRGQTQQVIRLAESTRKCFHPKPALYWEWALDARAILLIKEATRQSTHPDESRYTADYMGAQSQALADDQALLP